MLDVKINLSITISVVLLTSKTVNAINYASARLDKNRFPEYQKTLLHKK